MAITDELRDNIKGAEQLYGREFPRLTAIADRIDAEHEEALLSARNHGYELGCEDAYEAAYQDGENAILAVLDKRGNSDVDKTMAEHGWYRALDADKQPVRIGAEMDSDHYEDGTVVGLQFFNTANKTPRVLIAIRPHGWDTPTWRDPESYHHAPTVEDVLRQFLGECESAANLGYDEVPQEVFDDYMKRLQLRGDAE